MDKQKIDDLIEVWKKKKILFYSRNLEFKIDPLDLTEEGLLLVHIKCPRWLKRARIEIAKSVQELRTRSEVQGKYGDKHWYNPLHFSIAFKITEKDFDKIMGRFSKEGYIGQKLKFDSPVMYERAGEWGKEVKLVYY